MGFKLRVNTDAKIIKEKGEANFINHSGVFDVHINFVSLDQSEKGAISYNLNITYKGNTQVIYGSTIQNTNGETNQFGYEKLNKLLIIAGLENGMEPTIIEETFKVGKDNTPTEFMIIEELSDLDCKILIKQEFHKYNNKIKERLVPYNFFRSDGATAEEIVQKEIDDSVEIGKQLKKILSMPSTTKPIYKENTSTIEAAPTEEEVKKYLEEKFNKNKSKQTNTAVKKNKFAGFKKR